MRRKFLSAIAVTLTLLVSAGSGLAAEEQTAQIKGKIIFIRSKIGLENVKIVVKKGRWEFETHTDREGRFAISGLPCGLVKLTARKDSFLLEREEIFLETGDKRVVNISLSPKSYALGVILFGISGVFVVLIIVIGVLSVVSSLEQVVVKKLSEKQEDKETSIK